jgi:hypothetical protein
MPPSFDIIAMRTCSQLLAYPFATGGTEVKLQIPFFAELPLDRVLEA